MVGRSGKSESMRVLVLSRNYPRPEAPALGPYVAAQVRWLRRWHDVRVVSPVSVTPYLTELRRVGSFGEWFACWRGRLRSLRETSDALSPRWVHFPKRPFEATEGLLLAVTLLAQLDRLGLRGWGPDIIHGHFVYPDGFAAVVLGKILGAPVVVTTHGSDLNILPRRGTMLRSVIRWTLRRADRVIAVSAALCDTARRLGVAAEKIRLVPNGFEESPWLELTRQEARARLGLAEQPRILLYAGNLYPIKRVDLLLKAYASVNGEACDSMLLIVGEGFLEVQLRHLAAELGLNGRVRFVGARPHEEMPLWMRASDVVVLPSESEGWPTVVTEALAAGRPVVATRVGAVPHLLVDESLGFVVPPDDEAALRRALARALTVQWDEDGIRDRAPVLPWREVATKIVRIYDEIVRR